ncbi:MAG TPA: VOC family protein, partial [Acidimicrobiales bacterium]|nr:VOC family protein [Acidimicrobiales bacterium]
MSTTVSTPPDIVRSAYAELVVTSLEQARWFWVDLVGFFLTAEEPDALYLRGCEELTHHNLVLRLGAEPALSHLAYRVRSARDLDRAESHGVAAGCRVRRVEAGLTRGVGPAVRVEDPLGFVVEYFHEIERPERLTQRYDLRHGAEPARLDHFNLVVS